MVGWEAEEEAEEEEEGNDQVCGMMRFDIDDAGTIRRWQSFLFQILQTSGNV